MADERLTGALLAQFGKYIDAGSTTGGRIKHERRPAWAARSIVRHRGKNEKLMRLICVWTGKKHV